MANTIFYWSQGVGPSIGSPSAPTTFIPDLSGGVPTSTAFNNVDFQSIDSWNWTGKAGYSNYTEYPISVTPGSSNYSFEKWIKGYFQFAAGTTNNISNVHFFRGNTNGLNDPSLKVYAACQGTYLTPIGGSKRTGGSGNYPILHSTGTPPAHSWVGPTSINMSGGTLGAADGNTKVTLFNGTTTGNGSISSSNWTDWIVLQLEVPQTVNTPGNIGTLTWKLEYDES